MSQSDFPASVARIIKANSKSTYWYQVSPTPPVIEMNVIDRVQNPDEYFKAWPMTGDVFSTIFV